MGREPGLQPTPLPSRMKVKVAQLAFCDLCSSWNSPGQNIGLGSRSLNLGLISSGVTGLADLFGSYIRSKKRDIRDGPRDYPPE